MGTMLKTWWQRYTQWWSNAPWSEQWQVLGVGVATILGSTYRLLNLPQTMQFLADQGRDALIAWGILHFDVALVGPSTSVGKMYLGPLYYYFMAPFIFLTNNSPTGPAYAVAFIGILTVPVLYWVGKRLIGGWPAFFATLMFACGSYVNEYTRFSWNPNPAPIVTLAILYGIWRAWKGTAKWWIWTAFWFAVIIQLHYVALLIGAPAAIFWIADSVRRLGSSQKRGEWLASTGISALVVVLSFVPLMIFNWRFDNLILGGFADFFSKERGITAISPGQQIWDIFREQHGRALQAFFEILGREWFSGYRALNTFLLAAVAVVTALIGLFYRRTSGWTGYALLVLTALTSVFGLSFYKSTVFFHYITYFFPVAYLILGLAIFALARLDGWFGKLVAAMFVLYVFWLASLPEQLHYIKPLGWTSADMRMTTEQIVKELPAEGIYNLALLSEIRDYRGLNYRYFLSTSSRPPATFDHVSDADYLVVIAENPREPKDVLTSPVYEISAFPKGEYRTFEIPGGPLIYIISRKTGENTPAPAVIE
jgi:hypothetical protein